MRSIFCPSLPWAMLACIILVFLLEAAPSLASSTPSWATHVNHIATTVPPCASLPASNYNCSFDMSCRLNMNSIANCTVLPGFSCSGNRNISLTHPCMFCWQLPDTMIECPSSPTNCISSQDIVPWQCRASESTLCLGNRSFLKNKPCALRRNYSWRTAFWLSVFGGGFGIDRFYLGHVGYGFLKLLSFGGVGLWTILDVVLIATGYVRPADGVLYDT